MQIEQLIKKLNNTELGKAGTHETYIQIPNDLNVSSLFPTAEERIKFCDKENNKEYEFRLTIGREKRICGLGDYYREKCLSAGDEILLEKQIINDQDSYYVSCRKLKNTIILRKDNNGYEVLTPERLSIISDNVFEKASGLPIKIEVRQSVKKRTDSTEYTTYYNIYLGDNELDITFSKKDLIEIKVSKGLAIITSDFLWKRISLRQGK